MRSKAITIKRLLVFELIAFEILSFLVMTVYKYYINYSGSSIFSSAFLTNFLSLYDIFYTGNLIWIIILIFSLVSLINILRHLERVSENALRVLVFFTMLIIILLTVSLLIPASDALDKVSGSFLQLTTKGAKVILLTMFVILKIFLAFSYSVISFSALNKFYVFRSIWLTILIVFAGVA